MSLRRKGLYLLFAAFVLRVLNHILLVEFAEPYQGRTGLPELVASWFETGLPIAVEVLALAAIVSGAVMLAAPFLEQLDLSSYRDLDRLDA